MIGNLEVGECAMNCKHFQAKLNFAKKDSLKEIDDFKEKLNDFPLIHCSVVQWSL